MRHEAKRCHQNVYTPRKTSIIERQRVLNLGLMTGCLLLGTLAATLWIQMVF